MVLIDRDGRIAAKDLMSARPGGITSLVAEALARRAGS
jgi:hypothetical protein